MNPLGELERISFELPHLPILHPHKCCQQEGAAPFAGEDDVDFAVGY